MIQLLRLVLLFALPLSAEPLPDGIYESEQSEEQLFHVSLSVWQKNGKRKLGLICQESCSHPDLENGTLESYTGDLKENGAVTEGLLQYDFGSGPVRARPAIRVRITWKDKAAVEFNGQTRLLRRTTFRESMYRFMGGWESGVHFLFFPDRTEEGILVKPPDEKGTESDWICLRGRRAEPVKFQNWRWVAGKSDHEMSYFMQRTGEYVLPRGESGEIRLDVLRSPVSDTGFRLFPKGRRPVRFWQSNDSNTRELSTCLPHNSGDPACVLLFQTMPEKRHKCTREEEPSFIFLIYAPVAATVENYALDQKQGQLLDSSCKPVYSLTTEEPSGIVTLKGPKSFRFLPFPLPEPSQ